MPVYRFNLDAPVLPAALSERLQQDLAESYLSLNIFPFTLDSWFTKESNEYFVGNVNGNSFNIKFVCPGYRNSFHPSIRGKIKPSATGSVTEVIMYMNPFGALFLLLLLFTGFKMFFVGGLLPFKDFVGVFAFFMVIFLFAIGLFYDTAFKAKKKLILLWNQTNTKILVDTGSLKYKIKCEKCGHPIASNGNKCLYCGAKKI